MTEFERKIHWEGDSRYFGLMVVDLTIVRATVHEGILRTVYRQTALQELKNILPEDPSGGTQFTPEETIGLGVLHNLTVPDLKAATVEATGLPSWPIKFEDYLQLPEELNTIWETNVYQMNPHWLDMPELPPEKKGSRSSRSSKRSQGTPTRSRKIS